MSDVVDVESRAISRQSGSSSLMRVDDVLERINTIQDLMRRAMIVDVDYGSIPGTNSKPTLLKPGAEKLAVMFRLAPRFKTTKHFHEDGHLTVESTCEILNNEGVFMGECSSMASTKESKYAWRRAERVCPSCGKAAIIKGKAEYGGGWLCWKKKDGCGETFADDSPEIMAQKVGRIANEDLADSFNTVLRIAEKRAFLGAIRLVTGSSALFDEEIPEKNERDPDYEHPVEPKTKAKPPVDFPDGAKLAAWREKLTPELNITGLNALLPEIKATSHAPTRKAIWALTTAFAEQNNCGWDDAAKHFFVKEESPVREPGEELIPF